MDKPRKNDIVRLRIDDLAFGGKGVGKLDGYVIFVEGGLPGDLAEVYLYKSGAKFGEGRIEKLIEPSPHRVQAPCEHFEYCGGCKWQNLEYAIQKKYKEDQLRAALIHIGKIPDPPVEPIIGAHKIYYYRNKMEFSFHTDENGSTILGLHHAGRYQDVFQLRQCHLQSEDSNAIVDFVRTRSVELNLPPYHIRNHEGLLRFLVIREGKFTGGILVNIVTGEGSFEKLKDLGQEIGKKFENVVTVSHTINPHKANIAKGEKEIVLYGSDHITERLGSKTYRISASSFFQTNSYQAQRLYDLAVELGQPEGLDRMIDLYTGTGTIAIYFSDLVRNVIGIESVPGAVKDAMANAELNNASNCEFVEADVEEYLREAVDKGETYDLMVLDPPRAGCHPKAIRSICKIRPRKIVYISCNPSTLARDLAELMANGYRLEKSIPIDMFPHTYHIESVTRLTLVQ